MDLLGGFAAHDAYDKRKILLLPTPHCGPEVRGPQKRGPAVPRGQGCGPAKVLRPLLHTHDLALGLTLLAGRHGEPAGAPKNGTTAPRDRSARCLDSHRRRRPSPPSMPRRVRLADRAARAPSLEGKVRQRPERPPPVRRSLRRLPLPPQRPQRRAAKYKPAAGQRWQDPEFPEFLRRAREWGALLACADESGLAAQSACERTGGLGGQTPVGRVAGGRFRLHPLAASSPEGKLYYRVREDPVTAEVFRGFPEQIAEETDQSGGTAMGLGPTAGQSRAEQDRSPASRQPGSCFSVFARSSGTGASLLPKGRLPVYSCLHSEDTTFDAISSGAAAGMSALHREQPAHCGPLRRARRKSRRPCGRARRGRRRVRTG